jgi:hypothetical protein
MVMNKIMNTILIVIGIFLACGLFVDFVTTLYGTASFFGFDQVAFALSALLGLSLIAFQVLFSQLLKAKIDKWKKIFVLILLGFVFVLDFAESYLGGKQFLLEHLSTDITFWENTFLLLIAVVITSIPSLCSLFLWDIIIDSQKNNL